MTKKEFKRIKVGMSITFNKVLKYDYFGKKMSVKMFLHNYKIDEIDREKFIVLIRNSRGVPFIILYKHINQISYPHTTVRVKTNKNELYQYPLSYVDKFSDIYKTILSDLESNKNSYYPESKTSLEDENTSNYRFWLDTKQEEKFEKWYKKQKKVNYGAIGGGLKFTFEPTGLGDIVTAEYNGKTLDLSMEENW